MELWQIAAALGIGVGERPHADGSGQIASAGKRDLIAERLAAANGAAPAPEADAPEADVLTLMNRMTG